MAYKLNSLLFDYNSNHMYYYDSLYNILELEENNEEDVLRSSLKDINLFLMNNGFQQGKVYELCGPSLSGKTYFINNLINNNINKYKLKKKILFIDTNSNLKINYQSKNNSNIIHINNCFDLKDLINLFSQPEIKYNKYTKSDNIINDDNTYNNIKSDFSEFYNLHDISFIIIDSFTVLSNKLSAKDIEDVRTWNNIIIKLINFYRIGIIFTSNVFKVKEKKYNDFTDNKLIKIKEMETLLINGMWTTKHFVLQFSANDFSYSLNNLQNNKKINIKIIRINSVNFLS